MTNVLFVCIGNSCRSQMAEGFARKYGGDVLQAWSAGVAPASIIQPLTVKVMDQKKVDIRTQFPKSVTELDLNSFDSIVNMSGMPLPVSARAEVRRWTVVDPMAQSEAVYIEVRDQIEALVMQMILDLRRRPTEVEERPVAAAPVHWGPGRERPIVAPPVSPAKSAGDRTSESSQRYGFGRVRRNRD
jgi:arsenate reductase